MLWLRLLGLPLPSPPTILNGVLADLAAIARVARDAPAKLDRMLDLGEEIATIGRSVLAIAERLDDRGAAILELGARLDGRTLELIDLGARMHELGDRIDDRGAQVARQAGAVVETATELIAVLPTLERALQMATPLEGAIDRFGRLVDRLPGGRRPEGGMPQAPAPSHIPKRLPGRSSRVSKRAGEPGEPRG